METALSGLSAWRTSPGSNAVERYDLVLDDWQAQSASIRIPLPAAGLSCIAENSDGTALAFAVSENNSSRASREKTWGSAYLLVWDASSGFGRLRLKSPK